MTTTYDMVLWMENNQATLKELIDPLLEKRDHALSSYDIIFHDDINKQFNRLVTSMICIEMCRSLGCSSATFYENLDEGGINEYINSLKR